MANKNIKPQAYSTGKILLVDPNPENNMIVTPEDLNIYVKLKTIKKERSSITVNNITESTATVAGGTEGGIISFIAGSKLGGDRVLTTHYTELNTKFNEKNKDLETLGITSINIDFNSSYAPLVTINFVDIRGELFTMGNDSPYNVFFNLPYPLFELTIKGYYGKPVTYCLHLTKFTGKLNDTSGNFEISCNFIGYTYAFLTDMLIGYLRAVPYTSQAKSIIEDKKNGDFITFDELISGVSSLSVKIEKMKNDDPQLKAVSKANDVIIQLESIKESLFTELKDTFDGTIVPNGENSTDGVLILDARKKVDDLKISSYNQKITDLANEIISTSPELSLNVDDLKILDNKYIDSNVSKGLYEKDEYDKYVKNYDGSLITKLSDVEYHRVSKYIIKLTGVAGAAKINILDFSKTFNNLNTQIKSLKEKVKLGKEDLANSFSNEIGAILGGPTGVNFTPTIYNFFKILADHVDIFVEVLKKVSEAAKLDRDKLKSITNNLDKVVGSEVGNVLPWPDYREYDAEVNGHVDKWIGNVAPDIAEVKFIEELLEGLLKARLNDNEALTGLEENGVETWVPINPLDAPIFTNFNNVWTTVGNSTPDDVIRLLLIRMSIFLNSNRNLSFDDVITMAKIEANNAYSTLTDNGVKGSINMYGNKDQNSDKQKYVIDKSLSGFKPWTNEGKNINGGQIFKRFDKDVDPDLFSYLNLTEKDLELFYEYIYAPQESGIPANSTSYNKKVGYLPINMTLPIYSVNSDANFYNGNLLIEGNNNQRKELRDSGNLFFSNYIGANSSSNFLPVDDGSTFIKIIKPEEYKGEKNIKYPEYVEKILSSSNLKLDNLTLVTDEVAGQFFPASKDDNLNNYIPSYAGQYKTYDFTTVQLESDGTQLPSWIMFYGSSRAPFVTGKRLDSEKGGSRSTLFDIKSEWVKSDGTLVIPDTVYAGYPLEVYLKDPNNFNDKWSYSKINPNQKNIISTINSAEYKVEFNDAFNYGDSILFIRRTRRSGNKSNPDSPSYYNSFSDTRGMILREAISQGVAAVPFIEYQVIENREKHQIAPSSTNVESQFSISLFGSDFYCSQTNESAKALLFLHTIPFNGISKLRGPNVGDSTPNDEDNELGFDLFKYVHSLFDQRAGFIEVPYSWILFLGGLLKRFRVANDFLVFRTPNGSASYINSLSSGLVRPSKDSYLLPLTNEPFGLMFEECTGFGDSAACTNQYIELTNRIKRLPYSVMDTFIHEFDNWVNDENGWLSLKSKLEIFKPDVTRDERLTYWLNFDKRMRTSVVDLYNDDILRNGVLKDYIIIQKDLRFKDFNSDANGTLKSFAGATSIAALKTAHSNVDNGSPFNFFLEIRESSDASNGVLKFLTQTKVIANATWRIWASDVDDDATVLNPQLETYASQKRFPFVMRGEFINKYLNAFFTEWADLNKNNTLTQSKSKDEIKKELFNTIKSDDIKLNLYKNIKSIYDKWIAGDSDNFGCQGPKDLIEHFRFIDRSYSDIKDKFKVNPINMVEQIIRDYNQSFYEYTARVLVDNNFDFIPLPSFINYNSVDDIRSVFDTYPTYGAELNNSGPQFICMYIGERSSKLDLGKQSQYDNDSFDITLTDGAQGKTIDSTRLGDGAEDFLDDSDSGRVPVFLVKYASQNQGIFTNFKLDQTEFTETDESLQIIDGISLNGGPNKVSGLGQNLFDIYNTRSYSTEIEMLGNAQIQPLMYFQLNNVPMFHGAYTIIKVTHDIRPNHMTTKFKGVRIKKVKTKMIDDDTIFMNLIGSLSDVDSSNASLNDLSNSSSSRNAAGSNRPGWGGCITFKLGNAQGISPQTDDNSNKFESYSIKEVYDFMRLVGSKYNDYAKNKPFTDTIYYRDLSLQYGGKLTPHQTHNTGLSIDFRMIRNDKKNSSFTINDSTYNQAETFNLIRMILDLGKTIKGFNKNGNIIRTIYFDDPEAVTTFSGYKGYPSDIVKKIGNHDNHIHIQFNLPDRIENQAPNYIDCKELLPPTLNASILGDLPNILIKMGYPENSFEHQFAYQIAKKEGFGDTNPNVRPRRNNNPGNLSGVSEFKNIDPNVTLENAEKPVYAKFSNVEFGTKALVERKIIKWANGGYPSTVVNGPDGSFRSQYGVPNSLANIGGKNVKLTIEQFMYIYAPPNENNTEGYISNLVSALNTNGFNVSRTSVIYDYLLKK